LKDFVNTVTVEEGEGGARWGGVGGGGLKCTLLL